MCCVWISEQTAIISLYSINWLLLGFLYQVKKRIHCIDITFVRPSVRPSTCHLVSATTQSVGMSWNSIQTFVTKCQSSVNCKNIGVVTVTFHFYVYSLQYTVQLATKIFWLTLTWVKIGTLKAVLYLKSLVSLTSVLCTFLVRSGWHSLPQICTQWLWVSVSLVKIDAGKDELLWGAQNNEMTDVWTVKPHDTGYGTPWYILCTTSRGYTIISLVNNRECFLRGRNWILTL